MSLGDEELDVYRLAIAYVAWVYEKAANLDGVHRAARDQWPRASQSIPLIIAKGNGKTELDRMAAMLSRLGGRGYQVREETVTYGQCEAGVPSPIAIAIWMKRSPNHRLVATGNPRHSRVVRRWEFSDATCCASRCLGGGRCRREAFGRHLCGLLLG